MQYSQAIFVCQNCNIILRQGQTPKAAWLFPEIVSTPCSGADLSVALASCSIAAGEWVPCERGIDWLEWPCLFWWDILVPPYSVYTVESYMSIVGHTVCAILRRYLTYLWSLSIAPPGDGSASSGIFPLEMMVQLMVLLSVISWGLQQPLWSTWMALGNIYHCVMEGSASLPIHLCCCCRVL